MRYGITGQAVALAGEKDLNFHLRAGAAEYVVKVAALSSAREEIEFQVHAMQHAAKSPLPVEIPRVVPAKDGSTVVEIAAPEGQRLVHMLTFLPGVPWALCKPHTEAMLRAAGRGVGALDSALREFHHPAAQRTFQWDLSQAQWIREYLPLITQPERRSIVERRLAHYESITRPKLDSLRKQVIYNDANEHNILISADRKVSGLIDFGDALENPVICDAAIVCAYAAMEQPDPITAICSVMAGFHEAYPLLEDEVELLLPLILTRLCVTVTNSAWQRQVEPGNAYLQISERPAWDLLEKLDQVHPRLAHYRFRVACGFEAVPGAARVTAWLRKHQSDFSPLLETDLKTCPKIPADWSVDSLELANPEAYRNPARLWSELSARMADAGAQVAIGGYDVARLVPEFVEAPPRTVHTGLDLFLNPGSSVFAPMDGVVHSLANHAARYDYGPTVVLEHRAADETGELRFWTLYGHLSLDSLTGLQAGAQVRRGDRLGQVGNWEVNGGWPPHLHFQIVTDTLDKTAGFPGACAPAQRDVWLSLSPDPNLVAQIPSSFFPEREMGTDQILAERQKRLGYNLSVSYQKKLHIVRGFRQWLYDAEGLRYLDCVNNVAHAGHCHPRVVEAGQKQMAVLNTNTRYLHELLVRYAERLTEKFPEPLRVCYFVNSGSEANELALRLARAHTRQKDMVVVDAGYHGNTTSLIDISPYKFDHSGGMGAPDWTHKVMMPDRYRGPYRADDPDAGQRYARAISEAIAKIAQLPPLYQDARSDVKWKARRNIAAFICEGILSCGGQVVLPPGYLAEAYRIVREAGGICIADEVQTGFGRVGSHFWAFETQGVVPDIVTVGKPIGNGHPLGAVITTPAIAASFHNGLEYFNTFGGNAVSCAIGLAVLDVIEDEDLQRNALEMGARLMDGLRRLMEKYPLIGDVRGLGLFCGFELVRDRNSLDPAKEEAGYLVNRMRDHGILLSTDGPFENVIKIKPPLCFSAENADLVLRTLDLVLAEDPLQPTPSKR